MSLRSFLPCVFVLLVFAGCDDKDATSASPPTIDRNNRAEVLMPVCPPKDCVGCRDHGGVAYRLQFNLPRPSRYFEATIWGDGVRAFQKGESFKIDGEKSARGTGEAFIIEGRGDGYSKPDKTAVFPEFMPPNRMTDDGKWMITIMSGNKSDQTLIYHINSAVPEIQPVCE